MSQSAGSVARTRIFWYRICKAKYDYGTCGCFMIDGLALKNHDDSFHCSTAWNQIQIQAIFNPGYAKVLQEARESFGPRPMSDWPVFGCDAPLPHCEANDEWLVSLRWYDPFGKCTQEIFFLAERPPAVVSEVCRNHKDAWNNAMQKVSMEELKLHLPEFYIDPDWAPDSHSIDGVGFFPWDKHIADSRRRQTTLGLDGWGKLFMCVAKEDFDNLAGVWAMGADMSESTYKYYVREHLPKAMDYEITGRKNLARIKIKIGEAEESPCKRRKEGLAQI